MSATIVPMTGANVNPKIAETRLTIASVLVGNKSALLVGGKFCCSMSPFPVLWMYLCFTAILHESERLIGVNSHPDGERIPCYPAPRTGLVDGICCPVRQKFPQPDDCFRIFKRLRIQFFLDAFHRQDHFMNALIRFEFRCRFFWFQRE